MSGETPILIHVLGDLFVLVPLLRLWGERGGGEGCSKKVSASDRWLTMRRKSDEDFEDRTLSLQ